MSKRVIHWDTFDSREAAEEARDGSDYPAGRFEITDERTLLGGLRFSLWLTEEVDKPAEPGQGKPEFKKGAWKWDLSWLPPNCCSVSQGDYSVIGKGGVLRMDMKWRSPILNKMQLRDFYAGVLHIVVHPSKKTEKLKDKEGNAVEGKTSFQSEWYDFYCPTRKHTSEKLEKRGWKLKGKAIRGNERQGVEVFVGRSPFPCCGKFTEPLP